MPSEPPSRETRIAVEGIAETARRTLNLLAESAQTGVAKSELLALCDPAIHIDASRRVYNPQVYDGRDGVRRLVRDMWEAWEGFSHDDVQLTASGNRVLSVHRIGGRGRASGAEVNSRTALLFTIDRGVVVRVVAYTDPDEAAQGLAGSEP